MLGMNEQAHFIPKDIALPEMRMRSKSHLLIQASREFGSQFDQKELDSFVNERVIGIKTKKGVDILLIDFDHNEDSIHPITQAYLASPKTQIIAPEYFGPDLQRHKVYTSKRITSYIKHLPLPAKTKAGHTNRLSYAQQIAEYCRQIDKPIAVADIANQPLYMEYRFGQRVGTAVLSWMAYGISMDSIFLAPFIANLTWGQSITKQFDKEIGIFNKDKVSNVERLITDMEQARRLYLAKGLEQIAEEYGRGEQIVALYPKAHGIRVADILTNPKPGADKVRRILYKTIAPGLDYSVRNWDYDKQQEKWGLTSEKKIPA